MQKLLAVMALSALVSAGEAHGQGNPAAQDFQSLQARMAEYRKAPDTPGTGPYPAIKAVDSAFPGHVIYRPADLSALGGRKLPVLIWGNGGCSADGASQRLFLEEIASHGYLAVAPGSNLSGSGALPQPPPPPGPPSLNAATTADQVLAGLDEASAANARPGPWQDRIDLGKAAVAGYSCGGLQALQLGGDPRIKAVVIMHSGVFVNGGDQIKGIHVDKSVLRTLHTPVLYLLGGSRDIAYPNGSDDVARIDSVPVFFANHDVGHGGTFFQPNGGDEAQVVIRWLDWQLLGDRDAAKTFVGPDCTLCRDPEWTVKQKGF